MTEPGLDHASHTEAWEQVLTGWVPALMVVAGGQLLVGESRRGPVPPKSNRGAVSRRRGTYSG